MGFTHCTISVYESQHNYVINLFNICLCKVFVVIQWLSVGQMMTVKQMEKENVLKFHLYLYKFW